MGIRAWTSLRGHYSAYYHSYELVLLLAGDGKKEHEYSGEHGSESQEFALRSQLSHLLAGSSWIAGPCCHISTVRGLGVMFPKVPSIYLMRDTCLHTKYNI